ncbi:unnamed protein product [Angiostrongylus costaricensis]|uniref:Uncharacterized protein n=1 Tax=Angiostrongylus costaricensis TaxID=334426 RepID=A0A158PGU7_ANGCS|nr:unnamed protein product [Angiostrongylus costaricensis]
MRIVRSRASRKAVDEGTACSCAHSIPINCHDRLDDTRYPANISTMHYTICYLSALQAPPRPLAIGEKNSVVFTIEPFWLEPYWKELKVDNFTFQYDFVVKNPEHCEGTVVTSDDYVHFCNIAIPLNTTYDGTEEVKDKNYESSDNYDEYDDELPEEVEIDRDIFAGAPEVEVYYFVDVHQPRQLDTKAQLGTSIRDMKTSVESEILRYDLKSDFELVENLPSVTGLSKPLTTTAVTEEETTSDSKEDKASEELEEEEKAETTGHENADETRKVTERTESERSHDDVKTSVKDDRTDSNKEQNLSFIERITNNKGVLARWIFGATIAFCLLFILCVCIFRRRCCKSKGSNKSVSVNRYNSVSGQSAATFSEKERLKQ